MGQHPDESDAAPPDGERDGALNVPDDRLPEDLRPDDDNPLAQPADDDVPDDALIEAGHTGSGGGSGDASKRDDDDRSEAPSQEASSETGPDDSTDDTTGDTTDG